MRDLENDLTELFGERMKNNSDLCEKIWSALANVVWKNNDGSETAYSFREAGGIISDIIGEGSYMDWYCCGPYETVSDEIKEGLCSFGWTPHKWDIED